MGLTKKPSSVYTGAGTVAPPNPDPAKFSIGVTEQIGPNLVAEVLYPNCPSYEGRKILVFEHLSDSHLRSCKWLDPHFSKVRAGGTLTPVARCEPTLRGWRLARILAAAL